MPERWREQSRLQLNRGSGVRQQFCELCAASHSDLLFRSYGFRRLSQETAMSSFTYTSELPGFAPSADLSAVALFSVLGLTFSAAIIPYLPAEALFWCLAMQ
jgi:hypothetical protein